MNPPDFHDDLATGFDYYRLLNVEVTASQVEIVRGYRTVLDAVLRDGGDKDTEALLKRAKHTLVGADREAYDVALQRKKDAERLAREIPREARTWPDAKTPRHSPPPASSPRTGAPARSPLSAEEMEDLLARQQVALEDDMGRQQVALEHFLASGQAALDGFLATGQREAEAFLAASDRAMSDFLSMSPRVGADSLDGRVRPAPDLGVSSPALDELRRQLRVQAEELRRQVRESLGDFQPGSDRPRR